MRKCFFGGLLIVPRWDFSRGPRRLVICRSQMHNASFRLHTHHLRIMLASRWTSMA